MDQRMYFRQARRARDLSCDAVVEMLKKRGFRTTRASIANYELQRTKQPKPEFMEAINTLVNEWRQEEIAKLGRPAAELYVYAADHRCECGQMVPGLASGARHCLKCGVEFPMPQCKHCGRVADSPDFAYCPACGRKLRI